MKKASSKEDLVRNICYIWRIEENNRQNKAGVQGLEISSIMLKSFPRVQALSKTVNITTTRFTVRNKRLLIAI